MRQYVLITVALLVYTSVILVAILPFLEYWKPTRVSTLFTENAMVELNGTAKLIESFSSYLKIGKNTRFIGTPKFRIASIVLPSRQMEFKSRMNTAGLFQDMYILDAIKGSDVGARKEELIEHRVLKKEVDPNVIDNRLGCSISHLRLIADFLNDRTVDYCLIFEDDCVSVSKEQLQGTRNAMLELMKTNFDIFYFAYSNEPKNVAKQSDVSKFMVKGYKYIWKLKKPFSLGAYIVSKKGAKKLLALMPIGDSLDVEIATTASKGKDFECWGIIQRIFHQDHKKFGSTGLKDNEKGHDKSFDQFSYSPFEAKNQ